MTNLDPAVEAVEDELHGLIQEHEVERILRLAASTPDGRKALIRLVQDEQDWARERGERT